MEKRRCAWACTPQTILYHDTQWGRPVREDRALFEQLLLESFQAGLSWACILSKRENFRRAFDGFDPEKIARYDEEKCLQLEQDPGIVRSRLKIRAAVGNARAFLEIRGQWGSFYDYLCSFTGGKTFRETDCTHSELSDRISRDLRRRGMKFVGSVTIYAYLQAIGIILAHEKGCFLENEEN